LVFAVYLALDGPGEYFAGADIIPSAQLHLSPQTLNYLAKIFYECRAGKLPSDATTQHLHVLCHHPGPGVSMAPGRNAARVIFADLNLDFKNLTDPG
jgi:hypothetical protein